MFLFLWRFTRIRRLVSLGSVYSSVWLLGALLLALFRHPHPGSGAGTVVCPCVLGCETLAACESFNRPQATKASKTCIILYSGPERQTPGLLQRT